jgi:hypothetical protein
MVSFCEHSNKPSGPIQKAGYSVTRGVTNDFSRNILHHGDGQSVSLCHGKAHDNILVFTVICSTSRIISELLHIHTQIKGKCLKLQTC